MPGPSDVNHARELRPKGSTSSFSPRHVVGLLAGTVVMLSRPFATIPVWDLVQRNSTKKRAITVPKRGIPTRVGEAVQTVHVGSNHRIQGRAGPDHSTTPAAYFFRGCVVSAR